MTDAGVGETSWLPHPGEVVAGRFRMGRVIGEGGMGAVVAAEHVETGGKVAIKFLHPRLAKDAEAVERFVREAKAAVLIRSEHVVRVQDVGRTERGLPYLVMDLLEGADLGKVLARAPMPIALAVDCVLQAAEALSEAHAQGIVHRDIKPANLWLAERRDGTPSVRVLDFGISKLMSGVDAGGITDTRSVFGSPSYMSPEQIRSAKHVDHRTDVWALGVVLFELVTQTLPFDADNVAGILAAVLTRAPRSLLRARPDAPPELEAVIRGCLEKDVGKRASLAHFAWSLRPFASATGLISADRVALVRPPMPSLIPPVDSGFEEADAIAFGETVPSVDIPVFTLPRPSRLPVLIAAVAVFTAVAAIGIASALFLRRPNEPPRPPPPVAEPATMPVPTASTAPPVPSVSAAPAASSAIAARPPPPVHTAVRPRPSASAPPTAPTISDERK